MSGAVYIARPTKIFQFVMAALRRTDAGELPVLDVAVRYGCGSFGLPGILRKCGISIAARPAVSARLIEAGEPVRQGDFHRQAPCGSR